MAKNILLPTDRDTLLGTLKALTTALRETISLQRSVVGLNRVPVGVFTPTNLDGPLGEQALSGSDCTVLRYVYCNLNIYTLVTVLRTNIEIDDDLIEAAMRATGQTTKRGTVEEALRRVVISYRRQQAVADMDGAGWDGDMEAMRTGQAG